MFYFFSSTTTDFNISSDTGPMILWLLFLYSNILLCKFAGESTSGKTADRHNFWSTKNFSARWCRVFDTEHSRAVYNFSEDINHTVKVVLIVLFPNFSVELRWIKFKPPHDKTNNLAVLPA